MYLNCPRSGTCKRYAVVKPISSTTELTDSILTSESPYYLARSGSTSFIGCLLT